MTDQPPMWRRIGRRIKRRFTPPDRNPLPDRWRRAMEILGSSPEDRDIITRVRPYTMTGPFRIQALLDAVTHLAEHGPAGAFVECGVWRGGSVAAMLLKLQALGITDRDIYLYDTFEGMTTPTEADVSDYEPSALDTWNQARSGDGRAWDEFFSERIFNEAQVRDLVLGTGYPPDRLHFVKGPVEQTLPATLPAELALLRLDTDWYESTRHELQHLYPRLSPGGVLIVDDYGHWQGCRRAIDEYFATDLVPTPFFQRIDYSARLAVKP